jgi:hypothetical protein
MSSDKERKDTPVFSGCLKYFPDALKEVAKCSFAGQQQHNPDKPLAWDRSKSGNEYDSLTRHLIDSSKEDYDTDGTLHKAKIAWRALAGLQKHLENQEGYDTDGSLHKAKIAAIKHNSCNDIKEEDLFKPKSARMYRDGSIEYY